MTQFTMTREDVRRVLAEELPYVLREYPETRHSVIGLMTEIFARRSDVQSILDHLDALRQDFNQRMLEFAQRQDKFDQRMLEFAQRLDEFAQRLDAQREDFNQRMLEFAQRQDNFDRRLDERTRRLESHIGALGARWGIMTEESFRNGLAGILDNRFGMRVERFWQVDTTGQVFGRPDQVEIDVVVHDGEHWLMELKSSMSRGDVYLFERKVAFYEESKEVTAQRKIIISPMMERGAEEVAHTLGIEVYTSAYDLEV